MKINLLTLVTCLLVMFSGYAQDSTNLTIPYRPKIAEFSAESIVGYHVTSKSQTFGNYDSKINNDFLFKAKLAAPLLLKEFHQAGVQFKYSEEQFAFAGKKYQTYDLYNYMASEKFRVAAVRFLYERKFRSGDQLFFLTGYETRGVRLELDGKRSKYYISSIFVKKLNDRTEIGGGFIVTNNLLVVSAYPLFHYQHQFSDRLTISMELPKEGTIRYKQNDKLYFIAKTEFNEFRYNIHDPLDYPEKNLALRKIDAQMSLLAEKELHDWLWIGFESGLTYNLRYYVSEPGGRHTDALIDMRAKTALFFKINLFVVPPKWFYE